MTANPHIQPISLQSDLDVLRRGELSLPALIDKIEARFKAIEPAIEAYLPEQNRFDRLRQDAALLEAQFPDPATRPALFGALLGVKDIFHVDGFVTRAGSNVPAECFVGRQAEAVTRLKHAGALILGKTVTTEFAYFEPGPTPQSSQPGAHARRQQQRLGGGRRQRLGASHHRHANCRLGHPPGRLLWHRRLQAFVWARPDGGLGHLLTLGRSCRLLHPGCRRHASGSASSRGRLAGKHRACRPPRARRAPGRLPAAIDCAGCL